MVMSSISHIILIIVFNPLANTRKTGIKIIIRKLALKIEQLIINQTQKKPER